MKRIVYFTQIYFLDCDLPLIRSFKERGYEVFLFIELLPTRLKSTVVNIKDQVNDDIILKGSDYEEFHKFSEFIDLESIFIINRISNVYSWKNFKLRVSLYNLVLRLNPDVFHLTEFLDMYDCLLYSLRKKMIQVVHDPFPHIGENSFRREFFRKLGFKLIPKFVLLNSSDGEKLKRIYRLNEEQVFFNKLGSYDSLTLFKSDFDFGKDYVLFFGRISKYKGIQVLLEAVKHIYNLKKDVRLVIAGKGKFSFDMTEYSDLDYVTIINRFISMEELYSLINNSKVVVCPYIEATQSGVIMTAFTLNKPVIATNVGGLPEMVSHNRTGIIIPPNDVEKMVDAINLIYSDSHLYNSMVNNIVEQKSDGDISWGNIANKYIECYNERV